VAEVTVITATFNRARVLKRALDSVLHQDFTDWELIVVDDGSTDDTSAVVSRYDDSRIVYVTHAENRGVTAAKNTGLNHATGTWVTFLDSDDEVVIEALSTLLEVPQEVDPAINAVTCNCRDSVTGRLTGHGLEHDQFVDLRTLLTLRGDHWGITKRSLIGDERFNDRIAGFEAILWVRVSAVARRYYIHKPLLICHTEGTDRISAVPRTTNLAARRRSTLELARETEYLGLLRAFDQRRYGETMFAIVQAESIEGQQSVAAAAYREARRSLPWLRRAYLRTGLLLGSHGMEALGRAANALRRFRRGAA